MNNGRALKGHRRQLHPCGTPGVTRRSPSGGWDVSCICGWHGGNWPTTKAAQQEYRKHIDFTIDHGLFRCKRCGVEKPASEMRPDYRYVCLGCFSDLGNDWQRKHPAQSARHKRNSHLIKKFGITLAESERLLAEQGGVCAICRGPISDVRGYSPHVDHDHVSGKVRGILCMPCNSGLGAFRDDPNRLLAAIEYLKRTTGGLQ
jgi:hypothetical protein